ncbi:hypothetical protein [Ralstonia solanacearum]
MLGRDSSGFWLLFKRQQQTGLSRPARL